MNQSGLTLKSLAIVLAAGLLLPTSTVNGEPMQATPMQATKEGFAETDDGIRIHYRLLGPTDAPTLWATLGPKAGIASCRNWAARVAARTSTGN